MIFFTELFHLYSQNETFVADTKNRSFPVVSRHLPISTFTHQYFFTRLLPIRHLPIGTFTHHRAQLKNRLLPITSRHLPISLFSSTNEEVNRGKINPMQSKASIKIILLTLAMNICNIKPCFPFLTTSWGPVPWTPLYMYSMILNSQVHKGRGSTYNDHPSLTTQLNFGIHHHHSYRLPIL